MDGADCATCLEVPGDKPPVMEFRQKAAIRSEAKPLSAGISAGFESDKSLESNRVEELNGFEFDNGDEVIAW